jgi:hypothetical protein
MKFVNSEVRYFGIALLALLVLAALGFLLPSLPVVGWCFILGGVLLVLILRMRQLVKALV